MRAKSLASKLSDSEGQDPDIPPIETRQSSVQSVHRAAALLRALAAAPADGARLKNVAAAVNLDRGTVHRLLTTLAEVGLVEQDKGNKSYRLGLELFALASAASNRYDVQDVARASIGRLAQSVEDTVLFFLRAANDGVCVDLETGSYPIKVLPFDIGGRFPLGFGAAGVAMLASLPEAEVKQIVDKNRARMMRFDGRQTNWLKEAIKEFKETGFSYSERNGVKGIASVAVPLLDRRQRPVGAMAVAAIRERLTGERRIEIVNQLHAEVHIISEILMRRPDSIRQRKKWAKSVPTLR